MIREAIGLGDTIVLAKEHACKILGVNQNDVDFEIIQLPSRKKLGLFGGKLAKVRAFFEISPVEVAIDYLKKILMNFGIKKFEVHAIKTEKEFILKITGEKVNLAIGKRGDVLKSIQYLVSLVANAASDEYFPLVVNVEDYRERRFKTLEALGRSLAFRAIKTQQIQTLEPMDPYERWIIHLAVKEIKGAKSWSEGEDSNRYVLVGPSDDILYEKENIKHKFLKNKISYKVST